MQNIRKKRNVYVHWLPYVFSHTYFRCCSLKMAVDGRNKQEERSCVSYMYFYVLIVDFKSKHVIFLIIKPTRCTALSYLFFESNSTCFGQFLFPSSGVFHCTHSNGICHTGLLTASEQEQNQLDALISQIYSWNETLHVSDSSSFHHQEFFTVHTAMVYVIQIF
jgi:hypothetical protein